MQLHTPIQVDFSVTKDYDVTLYDIDGHKVRIVFPIDISPYIPITRCKKRIGELPVGTLIQDEDSNLFTIEKFGERGTFGQFDLNYQRVFLRMYVDNQGLPPAGFYDAYELACSKSGEEKCSLNDRN